MVSIDAALEAVTVFGWPDQGQKLNEIKVLSDAWCLGFLSYANARLPVEADADGEILATQSNRSRA